MPVDAATTAMPRADVPLVRSVLMVASEMVPWSKSGGLADVVAALPLALGRLGWDVTVVVPRYRGSACGERGDDIPVTVGDVHSDVRLWESQQAPGVRVIFVDVPDLFDRDGLYGIGSQDFADNPLRFAVLCRAALEYVVRSGLPVGVVHAHDWQGALTLAYLRERYAAHPVLRRAGRVLTIHNLAYQGLVDRAWLPKLDLPWHLFTPEWVEFWGRLSLLKTGIVMADAMTTVSPHYAREIQTPEGGMGLDGVLRARAADLHGIVNGIDTAVWNPQTDPYLVAPFSADDLHGKRLAKAAILAAYGLPTDDDAMRRPLIGMVSRMVDQKGLDLIEAVCDRLPDLPASVVILGTGVPRYEAMWRSVAARHPSRVGVVVGFDEETAHRIEAGADIFLMPSRFEPCGLNQMYSLRYGTVPVVRAVGGLADTVVDASEGRTGNGIVFTDYTPEALWRALRRATDLYRDPAAWRALQQAGMRGDHSWDRSAREYVKIYTSVAGRRSESWQPKM